MSSHVGFAKTILTHGGEKTGGVPSYKEDDGVHSRVGQTVGATLPLTHSTCLVGAQS